MINKTQFVNTMAAAEGITKKQAGEELERVLSHMERTLEGGEGFLLTGYIKVTVKETEAREGRNPATGDKIKIPAGKSARASLMKTLKDAVK